MNWVEETKVILQELIRFESVNPTQNEHAIAHYIYDKLSKEGIETEILHKEGYEKRLNVIAKISGKDSNVASLGLMGHTDVVPVGDPKKWLHPPFSGVESDGCIWGRGALDCKITVASVLSTMLRLKRENFVPEGDIIALFVADEEAGGDYGAKFLTEECWSKVAVDYLLNEGGGVPTIKNSGKVHYMLSSSEKGPFWKKIIVKGAPGHASVPNNENNAVVIASKIVERLSKAKLKVIMGPTFKEFVRSYKLPKILTNKFVYTLLFPIIRRIMPENSRIIDAMVRMTICPTVIHGGEKTNIIPERVEIDVDSRIVPGQSLQDAELTLQKIIGKKLLKHIEIESILEYEGNESVLTTPLYYSLEQNIKKLADNAVVTPFIVSGTTDSRYWRIKGTIAYGFAPVTPFLSVSELANLAHNYNERVSIDSIELQHNFFYHTTKDFQSIKHKRILSK